MTAAQERKASKLERKKQVKNETVSASGNAGDTSKAAVSSPPAETDALLSKPDGQEEPAQPAQTRNSLHSSAQGDAALELSTGITASEHQSEGHSQHSQLSITTSRNHAEHADVLHEFESLTPLPDMPKHDTQDELQGLFHAAFATCHKELSPRRQPKPSPFGSNDQDEDEDYSLYNDADEVMAKDESDAAALDASDEEGREEGGEAAALLLNGFIGDAEHAAQLQASEHGQVSHLQCCACR